MIFIYANIIFAYIQIHMKKKYFQPISLIAFIFCFNLTLVAQDSIKFREINTQVWQKFEEAFSTNNVDLLISLHTNNILRIPADAKTLIIGQDYFDSQIEGFKWTKDNGYKTEIDLRFIERINYDEHASEKGIFKFTVTEPNNTERVYFGKFHVLLEKQDNAWKISMDYDSNENGTITGDNFNAAYDKWNFDPFLRLVKE
jgi:hypothetical protein